MNLTLYANPSWPRSFRPPMAGATAYIPPWLDALCGERDRRILNCPDVRSITGEHIGYSRNEHCCYSPRLREGVVYSAERRSIIGYINGDEVDAFK